MGFQKTTTIEPKPRSNDAPIAESVMPECKHSLLSAVLAVTEVKQHLCTTHNVPEFASLPQRNFTWLKRLALLAGHAAHWRSAGRQEVRHWSVRTTREARGVHSIVMDDVKCPPRLLFLVSEIKHPVTAIHDLPAPLNELDGGTIQIESQAILAHFWSIRGPAERVHERERHDCCEQPYKSVSWHCLTFWPSIFQRTGGYKQYRVIMAGLWNSVKNIVWGLNPSVARLAGFVAHTGLVPFMICLHKDVVSAPRP